MKISSTHRVKEKSLPYLLLFPALIVVLFLVIYPFLYGLYISFTNMNMYTVWNPKFIGLSNYIKVFTDTILHSVGYWELLGRTIVWTFTNVFFHVLIGLGIALLLNRPLNLAPIYRGILILPWAIPEFISCLVWKNEFHMVYGSINIILHKIGLAPVSWLKSYPEAFIAIILVNVWLGFPFMSIIILGGLQSISPELYEAARIDGASAWQIFKNITLPMLRPVLTPAIVLGTIWTFNKLLVPFLVTQGGPAEKTHILVTANYSAAFQYYRYGFAAAFSIINFILLLLFSILYIKTTSGAKGVYE